MNDYNVNVIISGPNNEHPATYKTFILRGNTSFADQVTEPNTKYVIKWDFNLNGETVTVPENCILEFDGGTLKNGTIIGQDTFYSDEGGLGDEVIFGEGITKEGTWRKSEGGGSVEQIQSDWNQDDSTQPDFIKHKPEIPSVEGFASEQFVEDYTYDKETIDRKVAEGGTFDPTNYYNKQDIDASQQAQNTEIAKKANSTDLATVATSGSYNDLLNKPAIPAEQIQADWNQTNSEAKDFIKNKPNIPEGVIVDTELSKTSTNPVQNKVITEALENAGGNPDKPYDPTAHSGLGRKTFELKEGGSNVLTQEDFSDANTVYVIRYDFTLDDNITVPAGCTLQFDGGSISEGTLTFDNTIISGNVNILSQISGTLANKDIYIDWFLADKSVLNYNRVNDVVSVANNANIHFNEVYNDSYDDEADSLLRGMTIKSGISYIGNNCTIYYQKTGTLRNFVFNDKHNYEGNDYVENVLITGFNFVCTRNSGDDTFIHHFATIALGRAKNCRIENCSFNNWLGDAIAVAYIFNQSRTAHVKGLSENIVIKNCIFNGPGIRDDYKERNAISVLDCDGFVIESCTFKNMGAASQPSCIDFEPEKIGSEAVMKVDNVEVKDCYFYNVYAGVGCVSFYSLTDNTTINANGTYHVKGNRFKNCANIMRIDMNEGHYVIQGNVFESIYGDNFRLETGTIDFIENTINNSKCYVYFGYSHKSPVVNIKNNIFNKLIGYAAYNFFFIAMSGICNFTDNLIYDCGDYGASDYHEGILTLSFQVEGSVASFVRNTFFETRGYFCGVYKGSFTLKDVNTVVILNSGKTFNPYNSGIDTDQLTVK